MAVSLGRFVKKSIDIVRLERSLRILAGAIGILAGAWAIGSIFRRPDPRYGELGTILFRVGFFGLLSGAFILRAFGRKLLGIQWLVYAVACSAWTWEGRFNSRAGTVIFGASAVLAVFGAILERRARTEMTFPELTDELASKAAGFPESSYGATPVTLVLSSGRQIPNVVLAWGRQIVRIGFRKVNSTTKLGFDLADVRDVLPG
jgi:hypothetical protein